MAWDLRLCGDTRPSIMAGSADAGRPQARRPPSVPSPAAGTPGNMPLHLAAPIASTAPLATAISLVGLVITVTWLARRFGPALTHLAGWCSWWAAWACG